MSNMELLQILKETTKLNSLHSEMVEEYLKTTDELRKKELGLKAGYIAKKNFDNVYKCTHPIGFEVESLKNCGCLICDRAFESENQIISYNNRIKVSKYEDGMNEFLTEELKSLLPLIPEMEISQIIEYLQRELNAKFSLTNGRS